MRRDLKPVPRWRWVEKVPILPVVVAGLLLVGAVYVAVQGAGLLGSTNVAAQTVDGIPCETSEHVEATARHIHIHLDVYYKGSAVTIPANIGIDSKNKCLYWLHVHDTTGVVHLEAPARAANRAFTLGDFFDVWGQKLDAHTVGTLQVPKDGSLVAYINGKAYTGDPRKISLNSHDEIVLEITPPVVASPPASYTFPAGE